MVEVMDAIEAQLRQARPIPLTADARLDPAELHPLLQELLAATRGTPAEKPAGKLERLISKGRKVPLTDQVRFNRRKALKLLGLVRSGGV
jgi:hypothetical protein